MMAISHAHLTRTNGSRVRGGTASSTGGNSRFEDSEPRHSEIASVLLCLVFLHPKSSRRTRYQQADLSVWAHRMAYRGWNLCRGAQRDGPNHRRISLDWNASRIDAIWRRPFRLMETAGRE